VTPIFFAQLVLPLAAIIWLAIGLPSTALDLLLRVIAAVALLVAAALAGEWLLVPRLIVLPMGLLLLGALALALRSLSRQDVAPVIGINGWAGRAITMAAALAGLWLTAQGVMGRTPSARAVDLGLPFAEGRYLVTAGGSTPLLNPHRDALTPPGQSEAVDLVRIDGWGFRTRTPALFAQPADPAAYRIDGTTVVAPCSGTVSATVNDQPDLPVSARNSGDALGNHVILRCAALTVVLAGLKQGSVTAVADATVHRDEPIGQVGNSGEGGEPHLHFHVQREAAAGTPLLTGAAVPVRMINAYPVRNTQYQVR
jgi:hypothetical protein